MGDPRGARGRAARRLPARGDRGAGARRLRGDRARDGRGRELQQRLGRARRAGRGVALRRPPGVRPPHRRLGRLGRRLEGRPGGDPLEARRRGHRPLQPGLLRGSRGARARSARRAEPEDLGLRDHLGLVRPVHQGPGPAAHPPPPEPDLGGGRVLRPRLLHRLPDADHPLQHPGRAERPDLGRRRRPRRVRHPALQDRRGARRGRGLLAGEGRAGEAAGRGGLHRPGRVQGHDAHAAASPPTRRRSASRSRARSASASRRSSATPPTSSSSTSGRPRSPRRSSWSSRSARS